MGFLRIIMFLLLLLASLTSAEFLTPLPDQDSSALPDLCQEDTVLSCTLVHVDLACLNDSALMFNGTTLTLLDQPAGNNTFTFSSEEGDEAIFTVDNELSAVWGNVELADGRDFIIEPSLESCAGCHVVIKENREAFHEDHKVSPTLEEMRSDRSTWTELGDLLKKGRTDKTTMVTYTIKVYFTPEVKKSVKNIKTMVDQVIATTNQGYINSKIPLRVVLHCMEETTVPEAQLKDLDNFAKYKGGDNSLRGSADAAALLITEHDRFCGVGYMPGVPEDKMSTWPFRQLMVSMTTVSCALGTYTFGHEVSHNMGNDHDKYDKDNQIPYAHGYHIPGTDVRTIMAYVRPEKYGGGYRKEVNYYSNPSVKFKNVPTGVAGKADAARMITENRFAIAAVGDESQKCSTGSGGAGGATTPSPATTTTSSTSAPPTTTASPETTSEGDNYGNYGDNYGNYYYSG